MRYIKTNTYLLVFTALLSVLHAFGRIPVSEQSGFPFVEFFDKETISETNFAFVPPVNVTSLEQLYEAVNNSANAGSQIIISAGIYTLSATDLLGNPRPNGGRLELQENMSLRGVARNRGAVVIDAINLPTGSYSIPTAANTGAVRARRGNNAIEWLTVRNAVNGEAGVVAEMNDQGSVNVRIAHIVSTGHKRGIDVRNWGSGSFGLEVEIVDNDLHSNLLGTAQGLRITTAGIAGNIGNAYLSGNRMYNNQQGLLVENLGGQNPVINVYSSGDRFYGNGGGAFIGGSIFKLDGATTNFTAVGSVFENNNGSTDFYRGGLNVIASVSYQTPFGGSNNNANAVLRDCRFANNQVADLAVYGASSLPVSIGPSGTNNRAYVTLYSTQIPNVIRADSNPENPSGMNSAVISRIIYGNREITAMFSEFPDQEQ